MWKHVGKYGGERRNQEERANVLRGKNNTHTIHYFPKDVAV